MRASHIKLNPILKKEIINTFISTIHDMKNEKDLETFFKDFFNQIELETYAKRLAVAYWLKKKRSYQNIKNNLNVSSATIASVNNQLFTKGIKIAINIMEADEWANKWAKRINSRSCVRSFFSLRTSSV